MIPARLDLHIDQLILDGIEGIEAEAVRTAAQREMGRLLSEEALPESSASGNSVTHIDGGTVQGSPHLISDAVGVRVAQAVYLELRRTAQSGDGSLAIDARRS